jgi:hypothetical protein
VRRRAIALGLLLSLAAPRAARASFTTLEIEAIAVGAVAGAADVLFYTWDLVLSSRTGRRSRPTKAYAGVEVYVGIQQLVLGIGLLAATSPRFGSPAGSVDLIAPVGALVGVAALPLLIHGWWGLAHAEEPRAAQLARRMAVVPTVNAASRSFALSLVGTF